jgi:biopolymer transport protein ExbD
MGLKKNNRVNAQFSMSSLTDIIFLLLIFFMLSSSLVAPNALNLKLPGQSKSKTTQNNALSSVQIKRSGTYLWNGRQVPFQTLDSELRQLSRGSEKQKTFTIAPDKQTPVEHVVAVMDAAMRYRLNAILLPEK